MKKRTRQPIGDGAGCDIAAVEGEVAIDHEEGIEPREQRAVEGVDAADDEEDQELPREEMMLELVGQGHGRTSDIEMNASHTHLSKDF